MHILARSQRHPVNTDILGDVKVKQKQIYRLLATAEVNFSQCVFVLVPWQV